MYKWNYFQLPPNILPDDKIYKLIVYADENDQFFFFANSILWCLGYDKPHEAVEQLISSDEKKSIPLGSGIFLSESTVQTLLAQDPKFVEFSRWFDSYLEKCKRNVPYSLCPYI